MSFAYKARAFGYTWASDLPLYAFAPDDFAGDADITVRLCGDAPPYRGEWISTTRLRHVEGGSRFVAGEKATLDSYAGRRVEVRPGPEWEGKLPIEFFGTLAGVLLSWRGGLAMHGSAVEVEDGRGVPGGVLICGASGAGKSTLTAALLAAGARLISDDLSVVHPRRAGEAPVLYAGRKTMRLFPDVAAMLGERVAWTEASRMAEGKMLVAPPRVDAGKAVPLRCIVVLGEERAATDEKRLELLHGQMFRRYAYARIPGFALRLAALSNVAKRVPLLTLGKQQVWTRDALRELAVNTTLFLETALGEGAKDVPFA